MNNTHICLLLALFVASSSCFSIRKTDAIIEADSKELTYSYNRIDMPCATFVSSIYKAFSFYGLQHYDGDSAIIANYPGAKEGTTTTVNWNMCGVANMSATLCPKSADVRYGYLAYTAEDGSKVCTPLFNVEDKNEFKNVVTYKKNNDADFSVTKYEMNFANHGPKSKKDILKTKISITCSVEDERKYIAKADANGNIEISFKDSSACGADMNKVILFFKKSSIIAIIFLVVSLPLLFCGLKFIKTSLATIGFLSALIFISYFTAQNFNFMLWNTKPWILFAIVCLITGTLVSVICYNSPSAAIISGGAALGYMGAQQLIMLFATVTHKDLSQVYCGAIFAICILLGVALGWKLKKICIILATSLTGAFLFTFGLGSLLKNYPNIGIIEQNVKKQEFKKVQALAWVYLGLTLGLFLIGTFYQKHKYGKKEEKEGDDYNQQDTYEQSSDFAKDYY
jgi:hypothetical protein